MERNGYLKGEWRDFALRNRSKPGFSISSTIKLANSSNSNEPASSNSNSSLNQIAFSASTPDSLPSALFYQESIIQSLRSKFPLNANSQLKLPFTVLISDPLSFFFHSMTPSELHIDLTYSTSVESKYSRTTSFVTRFITESYALSLFSPQLDDTQPQIPLSITSPLLNKRSSFFYHSHSSVRHFKTENGGKTVQFSSILTSNFNTTTFILAPRWILPSNVYLSQFRIKSTNTTDVPTFLLVRNPLSDMSNVNVDITALKLALQLCNQNFGQSKAAAAIPLNKSASSSSANKAVSENEMIILQVNSVEKDASINLALELTRTLKQGKRSINEAFRNVFVFWSSGFGKKSGFLPLSELLSFQSLKDKFLIPDSERKRFVEMAIRSPQGETMKFSMQGPMRKYQAKVGSTLKLMYEVVARIEGVNSIHQM